MLLNRRCSNVDWRLGQATQDGNEVMRVRHRDIEAQTQQDIDLPIGPPQPSLHCHRHSRVGVCTSCCRIESNRSSSEAGVLRPALRLGNTAAKLGPNIWRNPTKMSRKGHKVSSILLANKKQLATIACFDPRRTNAHKHALIRVC